MMVNKMIYRTFLALFLLITVSVSAQKGREQSRYYMEAGLQGGGGDFCADHPGVYTMDLYEDVWAGECQIHRREQTLGLLRRR